MPSGWIVVDVNEDGMTSSSDRLQAHQSNRVGVRWEIQHREGVRAGEENGPGGKSNGAV